MISLELKVQVIVFTNHHVSCEHMNYERMIHALNRIFDFNKCTDVQLLKKHYLEVRRNPDRDLIVFPFHKSKINFSFSPV